jgi:predicted MFS family arabinose efflux permease
MMINTKSWGAFEGDVRLISVATAIRWIGWGMAEPLIPVFLFSLMGGYGKSGLADVVGQAVFMLVLPAAGMLADRISLKRFLIVGLVLFCFDGLWSLAAATGLTILAVLANAIDGLAVASDVVGRATYIRRNSLPGQVGTVMGLQNGLVNAGFIGGALIAMIAVHFVKLSWIFFGILPTNLIALYLVSRIGGEGGSRTTACHRSGGSAQETRFWKDVLVRDTSLHLLAVLALFFNAISGLTTVLLPIYAYRHGASLDAVIVLGIVGVIPEMFGAFLGPVADQYGDRLITFALLASAACFSSFAVGVTSVVLTATVLILRTILVAAGLVIEACTTNRAEVTEYGRLSATVEGLKDIGKLVGIVALGFGIDYFGSTPVFIFMAVGALSLAMMVRFNRVARRRVVYSDESET